MRSIIEKLRDPRVGYEERTEIMLAILGEAAMIIALIFDILVGESKVEIIALIVMCVAVVLVTALTTHFQKIKLGLILQVVGLVVILLPILFFFGGGLQGGGIFWIIFSYMFIGMSLTGGLRLLLMLYLTVETVAAFYIWELRPDLIHQHTQRAYLTDALVSILLVGMSTYAMLWYQKFIFATENKRAQEEAKRVEELNRSQNRFFSSMSHEIRTPINSILGLNEIILRQDDISDEVRKDSMNIQGSGRMLLSLINDILDFSKIEAGKMDIVPVNYKVSSLVSEMVNMIWLKAEEKGLKLQVEVDPSIPSELFGDEIRIRQILINLLNNAVKYTKEGSVTLHIEKEKECDDKILLMLTVSDTGMGIKQEALPHLFDVFRRDDEEKNRRIEGTGLGLSIVKQLVDLMDGTITVNSIYTQGSTFTVSLWQAVANTETVGNLNIENFGNDGKGRKYESSFVAPEAKVLIVDDNEMNLEVETKLLAETNILIETAASGLDALKKTAVTHYDVIFLDHLMPEMDGIECLMRIRKQREETNIETPIVVLTANAGAENKELYMQSGFDAILLKPVSGKALEDTLLRLLPEEKVQRKADDLIRREMNTAKGYRRKVPVLITSSSMCDIPAEVIRNLQLDIIPFYVHTDKGVFWDNMEADSDELVQFLKEGRGTIKSEPPTVDEFEAFFEERLKRAHRIIHIAITASVSHEYERALRAAKSFENVTVINSECLSGSTGLLVLLGARMVQQNQSADQILAVLNYMKRRISTAFIVGSTEHMMRGGLITERMNRIMTILNLRPSLVVNNDKFGLDHIFMGKTENCHKRYIRRVLSRCENPDLDVIFVSYVDLSEEQLEWIAQEIRKYHKFEHIVMQKASAAIAANCGPGSFGLLFMEEKRNDGYTISNLLPSEVCFGQEVDYADDDYDEENEESESFDTSVENSLFASIQKVETENSRYAGLQGIHAEEAIKNSGSEEAFASVLKIFYDSIEQKKAEIEGFYDSENWKDYTIKVHALKSSAKLVGALELAQDAQRMEDAGKAEDIAFIREHHESLMQAYANFREVLKGEFAQDATQEDMPEKPVADSALMESVYEVFAEAAEAMDCDALEETLKEMEAYSVPESEALLYEELKKCADNLDYEGIINALQKKNG